MKYVLMRLLGRPELWLALLLAWETGSALRAMHTPWEYDALTEWVRWATGISLALALGALLTHMRQAAWLLVAIAGALALNGLWQASRGDAAVSGPYGDHQLYGSALLILLPSALAFSAGARTPFQRGMAQCIALAVCVALALSQTRSAWIGAAVGIAVFAWVWLWAARPPWRTLALPGLLGLGVVLAFTAIVETTELQKPLVLRMQTLQAFSTDTSWQARLIAWRGAGHMAAQSPWVGIGLGQYPAHQRAFTHIGRALAPHQRPSLTEEAHDFYLQTAAEIGWLGVGLYALALIAVVGRGLVTLRSQRGRHVGSRAVLVAATLALIAAQLTDAVANPAWQFGDVSLLFWASLGIGLSAINRPEATPDFFAPRRLALRGVAAGAFAVILAAPVLPWGLLPPVEAYTGGTGLTLISVTLSPDIRHITLRGSSARVALTATGHFRVTQSGEAAPDENLTWNGAAANGFSSTKFVARGAWRPPLGLTGFGTDPDSRNILTLDAREGAKTGHRITVQTLCFIKDDQNERGRIVASAPASILCYP